MFKLRDYQVELSDKAVALLNEYKIACLSVEVRCGKTLTALETARKYGAKKVLFITKLKAMSSITKDYHLLQPGFDLVTINYESLHNVLDDFDFIIVDECHKCGAFPKPSVCVYELRRLIDNKPCILMSGTFSPESFSQLYHIFSVTRNSPFIEFKSFYSWANIFVKKKVKYIYNRQITDYSDANKELIDTYTKHLFLTWTQEQSGFTQEVQEEVLYVKMKDSTYWLADKLLKKRVHIGRNGEEIVADTEVKLQNKLWQIYSGSVIAEDKTPVCFDHSKAEFIRDNYGDKKIAIFYIFKAEYAMLLWAFGYDRLTSDSDEFNRSTDKIYVSQIQSGSMGVDLSTADYLIFYNIHFSNLQYWQARARIQSKDRIKEAKLIWVFSDGGIEDKILQAVRNKHDFVLSYFRKAYNIKKLVA